MCHIDRFSENEHIIDHDIEIPRPKSHDIEITRPKNRDIGKQRQITHDIVIPRHFFRGQKATTSRFQNCNKATTSSFRGILKATTPSSCGTLTLMSHDNHMTITSHTWLFSRLCRAKWSVRIGVDFSIFLCKCEIRQISVIQIKASYSGLEILWKYGMSWTLFDSSFFPSHDLLDSPTHKSCWEI